MKKLLGIAFLALTGLGFSACSDCTQKDSFARSGQWVSFTDCSGPSDRPICYQAQITADISKQARGPITVSDSGCQGSGGSGGGGGGGGSTPGLVCPPAWYGGGGGCYTLDQLIDSLNAY
jgi:hypothetical protein